MHLRRHLVGMFRVTAGLLAILAITAVIRAQNLPPMAPTAGQVVPGSPQVAQSAPDPPRHAEVLIAHGLLQIRADNSSLNQILRSISHVTGLKITGGVEEQRVFGTYGPAPLSTILATLLDGTGANILLLGGSAGTPPELILTSRNGGPELPGPNSPTYAMYDDRNDHATRIPPAAAQPAGTSSPTSTPIAPMSAPTAAAPRPAGAPRVLTPEMVEQELLQMQAQQQEQQKKRANTGQPQNQSTPAPPGSSPQNE